MGRQPLQRGLEPEVIQTRRAHVGNHPAREVLDLAQPQPQVIKQLLCRGRGLLARDFDDHQHARQRLADAIVQIHRRGAPGLFLRSRELARVTAQPFLVTDQPRVQFGLAGHDDAQLRDAD